MPNGIDLEENEVFSEDPDISLAALERLYRQRLRQPIEQNRGSQIGQTLSDVAIGLGTALSGGSGIQAVQQLQQRRLAALQGEEEAKNQALLNLTKIREQQERAKERTTQKEEARKLREQELSLRKQTIEGRIQEREAQKEQRDVVRKEQRAGRLEDTLRSQYLNNPTTKRTFEIREAYNRVQAAAEDPSAAGDLALIFNFMKMQDPGSVVREGEFATAQNAAGVPDRIRNLYNKAITGQRLNPEQRKDFVGQSQKQFKAQSLSQQRIDKAFKNTARRNQVDPENIVLDFSGLEAQQQISMPQEISEEQKRSRLEELRSKYKRGI